MVLSTTLLVACSLSINSPGHAGRSGRCVNQYKDSEGVHRCIRYDFGVHLWKDIPAMENGVVNAVIEIPQFTSGKWEVDMGTGTLSHYFQDGKPFVGDFLMGYPVNYGMVPQTIMSKSNGWDGDPLDILALGKPVDYRGEVLKVRLIGVMHMVDGGERDDKLIGVRIDDPRFKEIQTFSDLLMVYKGFDQILIAWCANYKYPYYRKDTITISGFSEREEAIQLLNAGTTEYQKINGPEKP